MAKSRQTFGKRENEKKKQQKRKLKAEKMEERKGISNKGLGLDSMLVYVDENGHLTATPPDPKRRPEIAAEDIKVAVARQLPEDPERTGTVSFFNEQKGYGFIKDQLTKESIFVHINNLLEMVQENNKVTFEIANTDRGHAAVKVKLAS